MKLLTIWCYYPDSAIECLDAWDEYTADDNCTRPAPKTVLLLSAIQLYLS